jgi:hypothetical protein
VGRGAAYISFGSRLCEVCRAAQRTELGREDRVRRSGSYKVLSSHDVLLIRYNALQDSPRVVSRKRRNPAEWMISQGHGLVTPSQAWATQPRRSWQPPPPVCRQLLERPTATSNVSNDNYSFTPHATSTGCVASAMRRCFREIGRPGHHSHARQCLNLSIIVRLVPFCPSANTV